jgi:hypothetical protein
MCIHENPVPARCGNTCVRSEDVTGLQNTVAHFAWRFLVLVLVLIILLMLMLMLCYVMFGQE